MSSENQTGVVEKEQGTNGAASASPMSVFVGTSKIVPMFFRALATSSSNANEYYVDLFLDMHGKPERQHIQLLHNVLLTIDTPVSVNPPPFTYTTDPNAENFCIIDIPQATVQATLSRVSGSAGELKLTINYDFDSQWTIGECDITLIDPRIGGGSGA